MDHVLHLTTPFALVWVGGLLGSSHCLGMCGPFALALGADSSQWRRNLRRQLAYTAGRLFTYTCLGAIAGYGAWRLRDGWPVARQASALLAIAAGLLLIYLGLQSTGVWARKGVRGGGPCLVGGPLMQLLRSTQWTHVFLAGLLTGMLPCGLVYGFLAMAASTASVFDSAALMLAFGLGTAPAMVIAGISATLLNLRLRQRIYQAAAWCVVVTGLISIARGAGYLEVPGWNREPGCPGCVGVVEPTWRASKAELPE